MTGGEEVRTSYSFHNHPRDNKNHTFCVKTFSEPRRPEAMNQIAEPFPRSPVPCTCVSMLVVMCGSLCVRGELQFCNWPRAHECDSQRSRQQ